MRARVNPSITDVFAVNDGLPRARTDEPIPKSLGHDLASTPCADDLRPLQTNRNEKFENSATDCHDTDHEYDKHESMRQPRILSSKCFPIRCWFAPSTTAARRGRSTSPPASEPRPTRQTCLALPPRTSFSCSSQAALSACNRSNSPRCATSAESLASASALFRC